MIYLSSQLYSKEFENNHIDFFKESVRKTIKSFIKFYRNDIEEKGEDAFIRALLINPFSEESRKFKLLNDYFEIAQFFRLNAGYFDLPKKKRNLSFIDKSSATVTKCNIRYDYYKKKLSQNKISDIEIYIKKIKAPKYSLLDTAYKAKLVKNSGVEVCPYCNRQYVDAFDRAENDSITHAQLDHFYNQHYFPLYSVSLYNLIPSCAKCNLLKSDKLDGYLYPFVKDQQTANTKNRRKYFGTQCDDVLALTPIKRESLEVIIDVVPNDSKEKANASAHYHEQIYQSHKEFVRRLYRHKMFDNNLYRKHFFTLISCENSYSKAELEYMFKEMLYGFNGSDEELLKKPLSKLAHDILKLNN